MLGCCSRRRERAGSVHAAVYVESELQLYSTKRVLARFTRRLGFLARRSEAKPEVLNIGGS